MRRERRELNQGSKYKRRMGMVLSGGGARGAFQVGVYERLLDDPRFAAGPIAISGTSAGAINAALIAAGRTPKEMLAFWHSIGDNPPATASPQFFSSATRTLLRLLFRETLCFLLPGKRWRQLAQRLSGHLPPQPGDLLAFLVEYLLATRFDLVSEFLSGITEPFLADTTALRDRLVEALGGEKVPTDRVHLAVNTVDAHSGRVVRFVTRSTPLTRPPDYHIVDAITVDMIMASCAIPLLFPPVRIGPHLLWDGGLLVNTPLAPVVALGAEEIIPVLITEPAEAGAEPLAHFGRAVERTVDSLLENAYNVDRKLLLERNRLAALDRGSYRAVTLYEAVRPAKDGVFNAGSYLYFDRHVLNQMYMAGVRAAESWLEAGPPVDHLEEAPTLPAASPA
ncbi:MAG: patatin-like phospholipase family protein [Candidatus Binatia bacterium]|nr:patatin-like phospholipase family protein [Candidatus Binatia bacterium]